MEHKTPQSLAREIWADYPWADRDYGYRIASLVSHCFLYSVATNLAKFTTQKTIIPARPNPKDLHKYVNVATSVLAMLVFANLC